VFEVAAEQAVELFEENRYKSLKDVLSIIKRTYHLSRAEFAHVKRLVERLLTWEMLDPQRSVDVC
jgi:hypothetical protein